jgi:hypothetical protein
MELLDIFLNTLAATVKDVVPVVVLLVFFQVVILHRPIPNWKRVAIGCVLVLVGLTLFLDGLETALFPIGKIMARQLSAPEFIFGSEAAALEAPWYEYGWVIVFGALIGFATTLAEPALIAVSSKAEEVFRGGLNQWALRLAVAVGVALGIGIGTFRIVTGTTLYLYILVGYVIVVIQTVFAPREIIPLAYDSGGVTTSTVTVPVVTALGLGLSGTIPGRNPALDGFGLIAFASVFPMMTVMGYAQFLKWQANRRLNAAKEK